MTDENSKTDGGKLKIVHVCEECGTSSSPTQVNDDVNVTGVVVCPVCRHFGPLNISVVDDDPLTSGA